VERDRATKGMPAQAGMQETLQRYATMHCSRAISRMSRKHGRTKTTFGGTIVSRWEATIPRPGSYVRRSLARYSLKNETKKHDSQIGRVTTINPYCSLWPIDEKNELHFCTDRVGAMLFETILQIKCHTTHSHLARTPNARTGKIAFRHHSRVTHPRNFFPLPTAETETTTLPPLPSAGVRGRWGAAYCRIPLHFAFLHTNSVAPDSLFSISCSVVGWPP